MRELLRLTLILALVLMFSCTSKVRSTNTSDADLYVDEDNITYVDIEDSESENEEIAEDLGLEEAGIDSMETQLTDEEAIYRFSLAEEYYAFGVAANLKKDWEEAQYNFERAIDILSSLSLEYSGDNTALYQHYIRLMNEITSDYKLTLFNLNVLSGDASPFALDEKFELLDSLSGFQADTIQTYQPTVEEVTYDMPIVLNDRVKKWIFYYQTSARKNMEKSLTRSSMYIPLMEKILEQEGIPHDLVYLPIIESGFSARAYSRVAAVGFWQFMSYTAKDWGMKMNWWYDERRDFEISTRSAARYLRYLHSEFNDWRLALTAYNGGPGNVNKMIRKNKGKDYWDWKIRNREMRNFVAKYMAATIIAKQPEKYGFDAHRAEPLVWDVVTIDRPVYLKDIASATGVSEQRIKELNPAILREYTPPDMKNFKLRIPKSKSSNFFADFSGMKSPKETSWVKHRISRGETVSYIAKKYRISQSAIIQANNLNRPYRIFPGKTLMIPVPIGRSGYASNSRDYELTGDVYIVQPGDYLSNIAKAFGTTAEKIASANNLRSKHTISVGQKLVVPGYTGSSANVQSFSHNVRKGETLSKIAKKYRTTVNKLCSLNKISPRTILTIGQKLKIPGEKPSASYASAKVQTSSKKIKSSGNTHTVRRGQNLSYIAGKYGTTVKDICALNGISSRSTLAIGQKLKIPGAPSKQLVASQASGDSEYIMHSVRSGQNLTIIAKKYGTTVNAICSLNGISSRRALSVGQKLKVPFYTSAAPTDEVVIYVVRRGDTLWDIAKTFNTSTQEIMNLNGIANPNDLNVGAKLKIRAN